jgi:hypothetical protein
VLALRIDLTQVKLSQSGAVTLQNRRRFARGGIHLASVTNIKAREARGKASKMSAKSVTVWPIGFRLSMFSIQRRSPKRAHFAGMCMASGRSRYFLFDLFDLEGSAWNRSAGPVSCSRVYPLHSKA